MRRALAAPLLLAACGSDPAPVSAPDAAMDAVSLDAVAPDVPTAPDVTRSTGPARATITRYDHAIDLDTRALRAALSLRVTAPGDCLTLSFKHPGADEVLVGDAPARDVTVEGDTLRLCHPGDGFAPDSEVQVTVRSTIPNAAWRPAQVGFSQRNNSAGRRFTYLLPWVGECGRIAPCDVAPSSFARYRFAVTHAMGTQVLCPGTITAGDTETVCEFDHAGGPTYSTLSVMALSGGWRRTSLGAVGDVAISLYDTAAGRMAEAIDRPRTQGFLRWMTERFGPYPYGDSLRVVAAPTYWSGFEHPGNITIAETLVGTPNLDHTVRHEIAHQWAGDQATVARVKDFVWKEAMAEYLAFVYEDETMDRERARLTLTQWRDASERADHYAIPDEDLPLLTFYGSAYGPGPMVLFRQLEVMTSRRQVMTALQSLLGRERTLTLDDVRAALEASTGLQLGGYFRAWLQGTGAPAWPAVTANYAANMDGSVTVTTTVQTRDNVARPCRFRVRLTGDGDRSLDVTVNVGLDGRVSPPATVRPDFTVTGVVINPELEALVWPAVMAGGGMWVEHVPAPGYDPFRAPEAVTRRGR